MGSGGDFSLAIAQLQSLHDRMRTLLVDRGDNWKLEMVSYRREQAVLLGVVAEHLQAWLNALGDLTFATEVSQIFSNMRRSIALTQSQWPLSLITTADDLAAYSKGSHETVQLSERFFEMVRSRLD